MMTLAFIDLVGGWWNELTLAKQLFYGIGFVAAFVSLVLAVLAAIGMEHSDGMDALDGSGASPDGGGLFSVKPLTGFFLGFGWAGGIALDNGLTLFAAICAAVVAGGILMLVVVAMVRAIYALKSDGTVRIKNALGAVGTVYVAVQPRKVAGGQVVVNFDHRQETLAALSNADQVLESGSKVRVLGVIDSRTVIVEAL